MIKGILEIGNLNKNKQVSEVATDIPKRKENIIYKIGKINFNLNKDIIEIDLIESYGPGKEEVYKFVQLKLSGRQNQFFATFKDLKRFVGESGKKYSIWLSIENELDDLYQKINEKPMKEEIENFLITLKKIKENFYEDYLLDFSKIEGFKGQNSSDFKKFIKNKLGKNEDVIFWTILINEEKLVDKTFYNELLKKKIIDDKKKIGHITCSFCNKKADEYFDDFARLPIKFFINDKVGFSQNLSNRWEGNFVLCKDCYLSLFSGEKFILNNFNQRVGAVSFLIIPEFIAKIPFNQEKVREWSELTNNVYNPFYFFEKEKLKDLLERYKKHKYLTYFLLNYVFYQQNNQQFKIFTVVKDIPRNRLDEIREKFIEYKENIFTKFPNLYSFRLNSMAEIYWIIPLRFSKVDNKIIDTPKITNLFASILEGRKINSSFLVHEFWIGLKAKYYKNKSYHNVKNSENTEKEMNEYILKTHQLIFLLRKLNLLNGGTKMHIEEINEEFEKYIQEAGFNERQISLFLLGTLIGDIGTKQAKYGSKPILNKINFQGMSLEKLQILFNEVYQKLQQEKLLYPDVEIIYEKAKELFDKHLKDWGLKPYENVYYILSGFSFKTKLNIEKAKEKKGGYLK
ncbi:CRISPR-associated protein Csh1 [Thermotomaculum hydrothermale]|uniref:CRISPR-associated protein Csh1 n=1 Tax=Thermotomaculum hydrothermale TaxID=981385 RepID=A0A7R6PSH7_9BACT|nr:TIGR02556 family CRISPR-associated protein [Thermotomaculum hydrothermale]BBB31812.1 CRISPR-associated protein Csh1 [Thermotomaculum hydrothermale]